MRYLDIQIFLKVYLLKVRSRLQLLVDECDIMKNLSKSIPISNTHFHHLNHFTPAQQIGTVPDAEAVQFVVLNADNAPVAHARRG